MKKIVLLISAAIFLAGCGTPATNNNANMNTATKPAAAPSADALLALDKQANEAYFKGDSKFFEGFLSDKFVMVAPDGTRIDKAAALKQIGGVKCDLKTWNLDEPHMLKLDADTYVLSYEGTFDGTCTENGKAEKVPSPIRAASIFVRSGDKWQGAFHGENLIVDPKSAPSSADAKKEAPAKGDMAAVNSNSGSKAASDANTDALARAETALWEAWMAKDAKLLDELTAKEISFVNIFGTHFATKAEALKDWTGPLCKVTSVSVTDSAATMLSPSVGILTSKGTANGTCGGQKMDGSIWATAVYVKDGETWKWAFGFNSPMKK